MSQTEKRLHTIAPDELTPKEALTLLYALKGLLKSGPEMPRNPSIPWVSIVGLINEFF